MQDRKQSMLSPFSNAMSCVVHDRCRNRVVHGVFNGSERLGTSHLGL
ncbi:hypothetical protein Cadr_000020611 [Camelus dromedarius]|uniref:Uncharacterized protein n=1 Tax=Camelus dromedarius TaxID=9838 RepID=A0A5N4CYA1_CAMDR|nr:hypothetical protein Cadr_000020611 [Camelus dromedarius]